MRQSIESGSTPEALLEEPSKGLLSVQDITPDGRNLIFLMAGGIQQLDLTRPRAGRRIEPVVPQGLRARLAPDGRSLLFTDLVNYYSVPFPPTGERPREIASSLGPQAWPFSAAMAANSTWWPRTRCFPIRLCPRQAVFAWENAREYGHGSDNTHAEPIG